jgi:hypothetical protein
MAATFAELELACRHVAEGALPTSGAGLQNECAPVEMHDCPCACSKPS